MTLFIENEIEFEFDFDYKEIAQRVCEAVLYSEACSYDTQINIIITDNAGIKVVNKECRDIDRETDVLSFPNVDYDVPGQFVIEEERKADYFDPETGELLLGDIMISAEKVVEQAKEYGHSEKREYAFLVAHSMLHLCGYDHMQPQEAKQMEEKQENVLLGLGITRD